VLSSSVVVATTANAAAAAAAMFPMLPNGPTMLPLMMMLPVGTDVASAVDAADAAAGCGAPLPAPVLSWGEVVAATADSVESPATAAATVADSATAEVSDTAGAVKFAVGGGAIVFGGCAFLPMVLAEPTGGCASG